MTTVKTSARTRIVAAAFELIQLRGIRALTLDGVACHAKLSKGGVLYHFSGKDDLISNLLQEAVRGCMGTPTEEKWRALVRALLVAEYMFPQALKEIAPLFAELSDQGDAFPAVEALTTAIGAAFLNELGLGALCRGGE